MDGLLIGLKDWFEFIYLLLNKFMGVILICLEFRKCGKVLDILRVELWNGKGIYFVGCLDVDFIGVLIFINDGWVIYCLIYFKYCFFKIY